MSLSRLALRIITARALDGATLAGSRVFDSAVEPIDLQVRDRREPFIVVLTDQHGRTVTGRDLRHGTDSCDLVIELAVATRVPVEVPDGEETTQVVVPHTDAGMEVVLDLVSHQIIEALQAGSGDWAKLWREFVMKVDNVSSRRGASAEEGVRFAARQITMSCDILSDPVRGQAITGPWQRALAAMEADADLAGMAGLVRYAIEGDVPLTDAALQASIFGIDLEPGEAVLGEAVRTENGGSVPLEEIVFDIGPETVTLTEASAEERGV